MSAGRWSVLVLLGLAAAGCASSLPRPDYTAVKLPAPYRTAADGARIDNESVQLDADGYRIDSRGARIEVVDVEAKMGNESSNAMAGYYISSMGTDAPGRVAVPSEGANAGAGYGPGSMNPMPSGTDTAPPPAAPTTSTPSTR